MGRTKVIPDKFTTKYESAVAFGLALEVYGSERQDALLCLVGKYSPGFLVEGKKYVGEMGEKTRVIKINFDHTKEKAKD